MEKFDNTQEAMTNNQEVRNDESLYWTHMIPACEVKMRLMLSTEEPSEMRKLFEEFRNIVKDTLDYGKIIDLDERVCVPKELNAIFTKGALSCARVRDMCGIKIEMEDSDSGICVKISITDALKDKYIARARGEVQKAIKECNNVFDHVTNVEDASHMVKFKSPYARNMFAEIAEKAGYEVSRVGKTNAFVELEL